MKYFVVGLHGSGKREIMDVLDQLGVRCGRLFSDIEQANSKIYGSLDYELFTTQEINDIFENNAYVFLNRRNDLGQSFYEGLTRVEFDDNDVFVFSPDQLNTMSFNNIKEPYCFVWVDNTKNSRYNRYRYEKRNYNFNEREAVETADLGYFVNLIYSNNAPVLYFNNDEPSRIATIIYSLVKYPDLLDVYKQTFNN